VNFMGESRSKRVDQQADTLPEAVGFGKPGTEHPDHRLAAQEDEPARSRSGGTSRNARCCAAREKPELTSEERLHHHGFVVRDRKKVGFAQFK